MPYQQKYNFISTSTTPQVLDNDGPLSTKPWDGMVTISDTKIDTTSYQRVTRRKWTMN